MMASGETNQQVWQDSLDPKLTQRLMRPLKQPGVIGTELAESILLRLQRMTNHLPVAQQLLQRLHWTKQRSPDFLPIVHAQPISGESNGTSTIATTSSPPAEKSQPLIVQGKVQVATTPGDSPSGLEHRSNFVVPGEPASSKTVVSAKGIDSPLLTPGDNSRGMIQKAIAEQRPVVSAKGIDSPLTPGDNSRGMIQKAPTEQRPVIRANHQQKAAIPYKSPSAIAKSTEKPLIVQRSVKRAVVKQISRTTPEQSPQRLVFPLSSSPKTASSSSRIQSSPGQNGTGVIQRTPSKVTRKFVPKHSQSVSVIQRSPDDDTGNTSSSGSGEIDVEDLANKVQRKLLKRMSIESERRGLNRWT